MTAHQDILDALRRADLTQDIPRLLGLLVHHGLAADRASDVVTRTFTDILRGVHDSRYDRRRPFLNFLAAAACATLMAMDGGGRTVDGPRKTTADGKFADSLGIKGGDR